MSYHPKYCTVAYVISCLLDAVDGYAARALSQTSKFGAVLDMVTDRFVLGLWLYRLQLTLGTKMHDVVLVMLSVLSVSRVRGAIPISDCAGLRKPLHAYV
jgi:phosphatidylglycerophosphate synthase